MIELGGEGVTSTTTCGRVLERQSSVEEKMAGRRSERASRTHLVEVAVQGAVLEALKRRPVLLGVVLVVVQDAPKEDDADDVARRDALAALVLGLGAHPARVVAPEFVEEQLALFEERAAVLLKLPQLLRHLDKDVGARRLGPEHELGVVGDVRRLEAHVLGVRRRRRRG